MDPDLKTAVCTGVLVLVGIFEIPKILSLQFGKAKFSRLFSRDASGGLERKDPFCNDPSGLS